ncbi:LysE family translocator [Photobacterium sp. GSS17]|uniref:LysE family translocator n=1 Tax=Photobacterium sp. GSS17 TaxID=3020715 RepID=UPI002362573B|nr:LysE family translocator [Photobacterium sp. GSS17]
MEYQQLAALATFAFVSCATPGPNNIMLMTSGANIGFMRTIPHMLGIIFGFSFMVILVGIGLVGFFEAYPVLQDILKIACSVYLVYLAYAIAKSKPSASQASDYQPMTFLSAAGFQWLNPKGWSMALSTVSVFNLSQNWQGIAIIAAAYAFVNVPAVSMWTYAGQKMQSVLNEENKLRWFNYGMAALLLGSLVQVI